VTALEDEGFSIDPACQKAGGDFFAEPGELEKVTTSIGVEKLMGCSCCLDVLG